MTTMKKMMQAPSEDSTTKDEGYINRGMRRTEPKVQCDPKSHDKNDLDEFLCIADKLDKLRKEERIKW